MKKKHCSNSDQQQLLQLANQSTDATELQQTEPQQVSHQFEHGETPLNLAHSIFNYSDQHQFDSIALSQPAKQTSEQSDVKDFLKTEPQEFPICYEQEKSTLNLTNTICIST